MYERPETPDSGHEKQNSDTPGDTSGEVRREVPSETSASGDTPTADMSGSDSTPQMPTKDPYAWQPGQYYSGTGGETQTSDQPSSTPTPQVAPPPPPFPTGPMPDPAQYGYNPTGQPTQYIPPQQPGQPQYGSPNQQYSQTPQYTPPAGYQGGYPSQPGGYGYTQAAPKDPTVGLLLELLGYVGFLGIGHIWAGKTTRGIALLIGWWCYLTAAGLLTIVLIGCVMFLVWPFVPIASGLFLKNEMEKEQAAMGIRR